MPTPFSDQFLPVFDVSDVVATVVAADLETTWTALLEADLMEVGRRRPTVAVLGALRAVPAALVQLARGGSIDAPPARLPLRDMVTKPPEEGGWVLLGERPGDEIALGLVGQFWRPVIPFRRVSADAFLAFAEPGYAKTIYALGVRALDIRHTFLTATMRTATTDAKARRWFRRYWTLGVGSGAHVLAQALIDTVKAAAEERALATDLRTEA